MTYNIKKEKKEVNRKMQKSTIEAKIDRIENIAVDKIGSKLFDFRSQRKVQDDLESEDFEQLKLSIEKQGLIQPIYIVPTNNKNGTYSIVDGSRRLEAVRQLGHKGINSFVLEGLTEMQLITIAISQNINRINLSVEEKTNAIINAAKILYKGNITEYDIKEKAKAIHNNSPATDKDFRNLIERLGFSANHVYQLLQVRVQLSEKALEKANELDLPFRHRVLLTSKILKITPEDTKPENKKDYDIKEQRQLDLIDQIRGQPVQKAQDITADNIEFIKKYKDLPDFDPETEVLEGSEISEYARRREADRDLPEIVRPPSLKYVDLMVAIQEFLKQGTGVELRKGQPYYKKENIEYTEDYRKAMIDSIQGLDAKALKIELYNATRLINSLIDLIDAKYPKELDKYK